LLEGKSAFRAATTRLYNQNATEQKGRLSGFLFTETKEIIKLIMITEIKRQIPEIISEEML